MQGRGGWGKAVWVQSLGRLVSRSHGGYFNRGDSKEMLKKDGHSTRTGKEAGNGKTSTMDRVLGTSAPALGPLIGYSVHPPHSVIDTQTMGFRSSRETAASCDQYRCFPVVCDILSP